MAKWSSTNTASALAAEVRAATLNRDCDCESVGVAALAPFYADAPVFIDAGHQRRMEAVIAAITRVTALPAYGQAVLASAPPIAIARPDALGVFNGFDFHLSDDGPRLIEINTNAGGGMLNAAAEWRHPACCNEANPRVRVPASRARLESAFVDMFMNEWRRSRGDAPLRSIAIVDDDPAGQFLHPEFVLFERLFTDRGIDAIIVDARDLAFSNGRLTAGDRVIDMVYNRVTDFYFADPSHAALRDAYLRGAAVITPHPHAHALLADKRNLVRLTDSEFLRSIHASGSDIDTLRSGIPDTRLVADGDEHWWRDRKSWFFKPEAGFGSRGAYRGDKLTRRVFGEILQGGYVAQRLAAPGERVRQRAQGPSVYKVDLRVYVYDGVTQLMAARLYQGQTTNFRTAGGGFAPVIVLGDGPGP